MQLKHFNQRLHSGDEIKSVLKERVCGKEGVLIYRVWVSLCVLGRLTMCESSRIKTSNLNIQDQGCRAVLILGARLLIWQYIYSTLWVTCFLFIFTIKIGAGFILNICRHKWKCSLGGKNRVCAALMSLTRTANLAYPACSWWADALLGQTPCSSPLVHFHYWHWIVQSKLLVQLAPPPHSLTNQAPQSQQAAAPAGDKWGIQVRRGRLKDWGKMNGYFHHDHC